MWKEDLIRELASREDLSLEKSRNVLNSVLDIVTETLTSNEEVQLTGFGKFEPFALQGRSGRNPGTGEEINIPNRVTAKFRIGESLKREIRDSLKAEKGRGGLKIKKK